MKNCKLILILLLALVLMSGMLIACNNNNQDYVLTLNTYGGSDDGAIAVINSENKDLPNPEKEGYSFKGWYADESLSVPFSSEHYIDNSAKLSDTNIKAVFASWEAISFNINYYLNGGINNSSNPISYTVEDTYILLNPSRAGYTFGGWYDNEVFSGVSVTAISMGSMGIKTFYAKWIPYDITYFVNGGTNNVGNVPIYDGTSTITLYAPTKTGYIFGGWYDNPSFSGTATTSIPQGSTRNRDFYAKWVIDSYSITYTLNAGTNNSQNSSTYNVQQAITFYSATRHGYTFGGWYDNALFSGAAISSIPQGTAGNITLFAKWTPISYNITYFLYEGENHEDNPSSYTIENSVLFSPANKAGYIFDGWRDGSNNLVTSIATNSTGNRVLYAKWIEEIYSLFYVLDGGTNNPNNPGVYTVERNITFLPATKSGYTFKGWFKTPTFEGVAVSTLPIVGTTGNLTLYAKFLVRYEISYNLNGGINNALNKSTFTAEDTTVLHTPTKQGYSFAGWYKTSDFSGDAYTQIAQGTNINQMFYAKWEKINYSLTYHLNSGQQTSNPSTYSIEDSVTFSNPVRNGYNFDGWYYSENFTGSKVIVIEAGSVGNRQLYAKWQATNFVINYDLLGGTNNFLNPATYTINDSITFVPASRTGYIFDKWYSDIERTQPILGITAGSTGEKTIYAKYYQLYNITYYLNLGQNSSNPPSYTVLDSFTLNDATKVGSRFMGWYTNSDFTGQKVTNISEGTTGAFSLYAKFLVEYSISYELDNGVNSISNPSNYTTEEQINFAAPSKTGYTFMGWYDSDSYTNQTLSIPLSSSGNKTIYALWQIVDYSITYHMNGGINDTYNPVSYTVNKSIVLMTPTKADNKFIGWYQNSDYSGSPISSITQGSTGNKILYAKFLYINSIAYELNGGENSAQNPSTYTSDDIITLQPATKNGYSFIGWLYNSQIISVIESMNSDITLYAQWNITNYEITYYMDGGETGNPISYTILNSITLGTASKTHYSFVNWYNNQSFAGDPITNIVEGTTGNIELYAKYEFYPYTINYVLDNGVNNPNNPETYTFFNEYQLYSPQKNEYIFLGWYDNDSFSGEPITVIADGTSGDLYIFAKWQVKTYSVIYMLYGGTNSVNNPSAYNTEDSFTLQSATRTEYIFGGWYSYDTRGISSNDLISNNILSVTEIKKGSVGNIVLYARWLADSNTITYVLNGGVNNNNNPATYTRDNHVILYPPTKADYTFIGWYDNGSFSGSAITSIPEGTTGNKTFFAKFSLTYNITYILNGGTFNIEPVTKYTQANNTIILDLPVRSGFIFSGWYSNSSFTGSQINQITAGSTGDKILHAKFLQEFSITYSLNSGTNNASNPQTYTIEQTISLQPATRLGYMFIGWFDNANFSGSAINQILPGVGGNVYLYAKFLFINELTYVLNGGTNSANNPAFFTIEDSSILEDATRTGYLFEGWYDNASFIGFEVLQVGSSSSGLRNLYAKWQLIEYDITYYLNSGSNNQDNPSKYSVTSATIDLKNANRLNYQFLGWYASSDFSGSPINSIPLGNIGNRQYYAKWEATNFAIVYNLYGGTNAGGNPSSYTVLSDAIVLISPTREGANFLNWYDNSAFSGSPVSGIAAGSSGAKMFFAKWQLIEYNIVYNLNGGTYSQQSSNIYTIENNIVFSNPIKAYSTFLGWYDNLTFTGNQITSTAGRMETVNVYAKFSPTYFINYILNGGTNSVDNPPSFTQLSDTIILASPSKPHYDFVNWYTQSDFSGSAITQIPAGSAESINLYAKWTPTVFNISYHLNGGSNDPTNPTNYTTESINKNLNAATKLGNTFLGWYDNETFIGNAISLIQLGSYGDKEYYAKWSLINYDITYHLNGGSNSLSNPVIYNIQSATINLLSPTKNYYSFIGWYDNAGFTGSPLASIPTGSLGNREFYAKYVAIVYDITYHLSGGDNNISNPIMYTYEDNIELSEPSKEYYIFADWYTNQYYTGNPISSITARSGNLNLYSKWNPISFEIVYSLNGGNNHLDNPSTYTVESEITLNKATKASYNFMGWYDNAEFSGNPIAIIQGANGNMILYAKFLLSYNITYHLNGGANNIQNPSSYTAEEAIELNAPSKASHIFLGWYNNSAFIGDIISEISLGSLGNKEFYARYEFIYTITYHLNGGSNNINNVNYYTQDTNITIYPAERAGYMFLGWYTNEQFSGEPVTAINGSEMQNKILYAWWGEWGYYLYYGEYPQTLETDTTAINALNSGIGSGSITADAQGYYAYGDERYAKQEQQITTNGFAAGQSYYFLVEPIKWRILFEDSGEVMMLSEVILDSHAYNNLYQSITWEFSAIRDWLNDDFYNSAFYNNNYHIHEQETQTSTNPVHNTSSGNATIDYISLLSIENVINSDFGFSTQLSAEDENRIAKNSDYAMARGAYTDADGNGMWWLYSQGSNDKYTSFVGCDGKVYANGDSATMIYYGVRPTLYISLGMVDH